MATRKFANVWDIATIHEGCQWQAVGSEPLSQRGIIGGQRGLGPTTQGSILAEVNRNVGIGHVADSAFVR